MAPKRGKGRGKGKGKGRAAKEQHKETCHSSSDSTLRPCQKKSKDQDSLSSPPQPRYATRQARRVLSRYPASSSTLRSPSQNVTRTVGSPPVTILSDTDDEQNSVVDRDNIMPDLQHVTPEPAQYQGPIEDADLMAQYQHPAEVQQIGTFKDYYEPLKDGPAKCNPYIRRTSSINITEIAKKQRADGDSEKEVESKLDPAFEHVEGHKVKREFAPLLREIFKKYGDVAGGSVVKSSYMVTCYLQCLCEVYQKLKQTKFLGVSQTDLDEMIAAVHHLENQNLNVGWLLEKLQYISKAKFNFLGYLTLKEEENKHNATLETLENELELRQQNVSDLEEKLATEKAMIDECKKRVATEKAMADECRKKASDTRTTVITMMNSSLVDGLLPDGL